SRSPRDRRPARVAERPRPAQRRTAPAAADRAQHPARDRTVGAGQVRPGGNRGTADGAPLHRLLDPAGIESNALGRGGYLPALLRPRRPARVLPRWGGGVLRRSGPAAERADHDRGGGRPGEECGDHRRRPGRVHRRARHRPPNGLGTARAGAMTPRSLAPRGAHAPRTALRTAHRTSHRTEHRAEPHSAPHSNRRSDEAHSAGHRGQGGNHMPLSPRGRELFDAYVFDLDGTIYLGEGLLPGAEELLGELRRRDIPVRFLSNNPTKSPSQYVTKLADLGLPITPEEVSNTVVAMVTWLLQAHPGAVVYPIAEQPLIEALGEAGIEISEDPARIDVVIASYDRTFTYAKLQRAFDAIWYHRRAILVTTNPDRFCPF